MDHHDGADEQYRSSWRTSHVPGTQVAARDFTHARWLSRHAGVDITERKPFSQYPGHTLMVSLDCFDLPAINKVVSPATRDRRKRAANSEVKDF